ncbi:Protein dml1 [Neolecta irregularis DAH-3]|uniref:Protein dml1 n=1 Tax=Neolecta irregularis (strain DAH-3) TaxID=1198029 RepID=A0A1U7LHC8_NEOID|nr:Protein dml1 [Neolecta irregularis DAH-3]|eukprot:OLL21952.1 Protein dml1 [Neolecta irregularis DAH-3]
MKEILTLQFGQAAGFLGAHFWNQQESLFSCDENNESPIDSDVHFRAGIGAGGIETFTPRVLIYDVKGGFGSLHQNALYESLTPEINHAAWDREIQEQKQPVIETEYEKILRNEVTDSNQQTVPVLSKVETWNDFNRVYYHPRSFVEITEYDLYGELAVLNTYDQGADLFQSLNREYDLFDHDLRSFLEECDSLQGIQVLCSVMDGWAGFSSEYLIELRDEFPKTSLISWAIENPMNDWESSHSFIRALVSLNETSSLYVPLGMPAIQKAGYDANSLWNRSAVLSLGYDSITLPTRLKASQRSSISEIIEYFSPSSQQRIAMLNLEIENHSSVINLSWSDRTPKLYSVFSVARSQSPTNTYNYHIDIPYKLLSSFPSSLAEDSMTRPNAYLSVGTTPIQKMEYLVELARRKTFGIKREELVDRLESIKEAYES